MYLVTGATGNVGSELTRVLAEGGHCVRAVVTRADRAKELPSGVEAVVGDLQDARTLSGALEGVAGLFLLPGYAGATDLLRDARRAGVQRLVQLSGSSAGSRDVSNAVTAYMCRAEDLAVDSRLAWTILRPSAFMTNAWRWRAQLGEGDEVQIPFGRVSAAVIDPADIAAVAAAALTDDSERYAGCIFRLSGPEPLTPIQQVAILGEELDRPLHVTVPADEEARRQLLEQMPREYVDAFFDFYVAGSLDESVVLSTVQDVLDRPPHRFADWVKRHLGSFAGS